MTKTDLVYISDILQAISLIESYKQDKTVIDLATNIQLQDSIVRRLEVIGIAANKVSSSLQSKTAAIPWRNIIDTRNRIAHDYDAVDIDIIWEIVENDLPQLRQQLLPILDDLSRAELAEGEAQEDKGNT